MSDYQQQTQQSSWGSGNLDDSPIYERVESFSGGEDSFRRSTLIDPDQSQHLLNVIVRENFDARTRPGADALSGAAIDAGIVQGLRFFQKPTSGSQLSQLIAGCNGKTWKWDGATWTQLSAWSPHADDNRLAMEQGIDTLLISDGVGIAQIWDGTNFKAGDTISIDNAHDNIGNPGQNCPIGASILCWHTSRMFASGVALYSDTIYVSNLLAFSAGKWNATTRSFQVGTGDGQPIMALASMQNFTLCVFKSNSVWLLNTDPASDATGVAGVSGWTAVQAGAITDGIGIVGRDAWCNYENDILFMAQDGVRSVQRMQAAAGQWQLTTPLSQPIQPLIDRINRNYWHKIQAVKYAEFAFFFVPLDSSLTNNFVLVWNGRLGKWCGAWSNWSGLSVEVTRFNNIQKLVFGDDTGKVNEWKDSESITEDSTYLDNAVGYPTQVWSRSFVGGDLICDKSAFSTTLRFTYGNAVVNMTWVADLSEVRTWSANPHPSGDILGEALLPFLLSTVFPVTVKRGLRGTPDFNEAYLKIESKEGWFSLRNITVGSFTNPIRES
jgi:hypothetical protein